MDTPTQSYGRYTLLERLAAGGMGEVWVGLQTGLGGFARPLAVKLLLPHLTNDEKVVSMFLTEARLGAQIGHLNVAQVYDVGFEHGRYFIAMEFVRGVPLNVLAKGLRASREGLAVELLSYVGRALCDGLHAAHEQRGAGGKPLDLVHRDVTPHNVLVSVDGAVKLTDFGIARVADAERRTNPGVLMGKLGYVAPEQLSGDPLDRRVDVFAAGATMYTLAALKKPFTAGKGEVLLDPNRVPVAKLGALRPDLPPAFVDAVERAMENDLSRRWQTALEFRDALPVPPPEAAAVLGEVVRRVCSDALVDLDTRAEHVRRSIAVMPKTIADPGLAGATLTVEPGAAFATPAPELGRTLADRPAAKNKTAPARAPAKGLRGTAFVLAMAAVGAAVAGVGWLALHALRTKGAEAPPAAALVSGVAQAAPVAAPTPEAAATAQVTAPPLEAPLDAAKTAVNVTAAPDEKAAPVDERPGTLSVDATPWGKVYVDGKVAGDTPLANIKLAPGMHTLVVKNPESGRAVRKRVKVTAGHGSALRVDLR